MLVAGIGVGVLALIPVFTAALLIHAYPSSAVGLGLALVGAIVGPALGEWKDARHQRKSAPQSNL